MLITIPLTPEIMQQLIIKPLLPEKNQKHEIASILKNC